jgi:tetratricopeptide (TPR) repeat protein
MKKHIAFAITPALLMMSLTFALAEQRPAPVKKTMPVHKVSEQAPMPNSTPMTMGTPMQPSTKTLPSHPLVADGQSALIHRKYPEAIQIFQNLLGTEPNNVQALNGLTIAYLNQGNFDEALKTVNKALTLDPVNSRLFYTKAQVLDAQNKPVDAIETYLTFSSIAPNDGAALAAQGRAEELYSEFQKTMTPAHVQYIQGLRLLSLHQPEQAVDSFAKCKSLDPSNHDADMMLGCAYLQAGQPEKAIPCFEAVLREKTDPMAYYQLGSSYQMHGETKNAQEAFRKFMQIAPQSETATRMNRMMEISSQQ